ncbi:MAG: hypothetical protein WBB23_07205 [Desulforhopalus sp.]
MRFVLTALIWLLLLGGLSLYIFQRDRRTQAPIQAPVMQEASGQNFILEITPTFSPQPDPFALQGEAGDSPSLVVRTSRQELFRAEADLERGVPVQVQPVHGLVEGRNELYLQGTPPLSEAHRDHAVRVRLLQDSRVVTDQTIWGGGGTGVAGTISFTLTPMAENAHDH